MRWLIACSYDVLRDIPGYDWDHELMEFWGSRWKVAVGTLPLTLLGLGAASWKEIKGARETLADDRALGSLGLGDKDRATIATLARAGRMDEALTALKAAMSRRDPAVAQQFLQQAESVASSQAKAFQDLMSQAGLTISREGDQYILTNRAGAKAAFNTAEEAVAAVQAHVGVQSSSSEGNAAIAKAEGVKQEEEKDLHERQSIARARTPTLSPREAEVEQRFAQQIANNIDKALLDYETRSPAVIDRDEVRELCEEYRENRTRFTTATTGVSGKFVDILLRRWLSRDSKHGAVLFSAGGQSSGKTTARKRVQPNQEIDFVVDGTMQDYGRSAAQVKAVNDSGRMAIIQFVYIPFNQAVRLMIKRAAEEGGRYVSASAMARGHYNAARNALRIARENPDGTVLNVLDNSHPGHTTVQDATWLEKHLNPDIDVLTKQAEILIDEYFKQHAGDSRYSTELHQRIKEVYAEP